MNFIGSSETRIPVSSSLILSALILHIRLLFCLMPSRVSASILNPSTDANRTARNMRRASSPNLSAGLPTVRMILPVISSIPPKGSMRPLSGFHAIALIVKSLLRRSSSILEVNSTFSGCLLSLYLPSMRNVVTSQFLLPSATVTVPCFIPVSTVFSKSLPTSSGRASVAISQSFGSLPITASRMQPPTTYASKPCIPSISSIFTTSPGGTIFIKIITPCMVYFDKCYDVSVYTKIITLQNNNASINNTIALRSILSFRKQKAQLTPLYRQPCQTLPLFPDESPFC